MTVTAEGPFVRTGGSVGPKSRSLRFVVIGVIGVAFDRKYRL